MNIQILTIGYTYFYQFPYMCHWIISIMVFKYGYLQNIDGCWAIIGVANDIPWVGVIPSCFDISCVDGKNVAMVVILGGDVHNGLLIWFDPNYATFFS